VSSYNDGEVPFAEHLLIAREGTREQFEKLLKGRKIQPIGGFPSQHVDYYIVSALPVSELPGITAPMGAASSESAAPQRNPNEPPKSDKKK
jgi:hypothetical protein